MFLPSRYVGDVGRVRQILTNLVGNAIKFTATGFVLVRVVGIENKDGFQEIRVAVEDSGIGISADKIEHVFGEFNQADDASSRKFEGTGLGLAITSRLISMMGGEIWVDSTPGRGSCFGFRLEFPVASPAEVKKGVVGPELKRALIVDDLEVNRVILARQLDFLGIETTTCKSAEDALEMFRPPENPGEEPFDIILTDHHMPGMNGVGLARELDRRSISTPRILLSSTASFSSGNIEADLFAACLRKPILRSELCDTLSGIHGDARQQAPVLVSHNPNPRQSDLKLNILVAEDNKTNQLVVSKMTAKMNVKLTFAKNGKEAVSLFQRRKFDLVFMDISMPEMDGMEATGKIREFEKGEKRVPTRIVALTAHAMAGDEERFLAAGIDHYLTKPLKKRLIAAQIEDVWAIALSETPAEKVKKSAAR